MLTLYYVSATVLQSWRIQKACSKIAEHLAQPSSIAFYALQAGSDDGFDPALASSELCGNRNAAKVTDILWLHANQRGCCLRPLQTLHITPWISFPAAPSLLPFSYAADTLTPVTTPTEADTPPRQRVSLSTKGGQRMQLLLEAHVEPVQRPSSQDTTAVRLEDYGKLIAWKIDSHLAVLIETDVEHFTQLLITTFLRNNLCINDQLPLLRIESVQREGDPQPFELLANHLKRQSRTTVGLDKDGWKKHLEDLRAVGVLAHQATEFEYQRNRSEGRTKPDLIAHEHRQTPEPVAKAVAVVEPTNKASLSPARVADSSQKAEPKGTPVKLSPAKSEAKTSPAKSEAKSTPAKNESKPVITKEDSKSTPSKGERKPSELEKLAAAQASQMQKIERVEVSPIKAAPSTKPSTLSDVNEPVKSSDKPTKPSKSFEVVKPLNSPPSAGIAPSRPVLQRNKNSLQESKPLNVLVYSDSASARESTLATLQQLLERNVYTIYPLMPQQAALKYWTEQTALLVVCGSVAPGIGQILVDYFLHGGKVLSLCSDILHFILPNYRTAEVREHELVQFSYDKWQRVKMMHHIFCYQPSPVKKHFSTDSEESTKSHSRKPSMELKDLAGHSHNLDVQVLGTEETWNTPSLMLAKSLQSGGKAVFSQVHLEMNPSEFESDEIKYSILKQNERTRLEIFADLLGKYLDVQVQGGVGVDQSQPGVVYQHAYFLGRHETKFELLEKLRLRCSGSDNVIATPKLTIKFCGKDDKPPVANNNVLPILIHSCPDDFSTVEYFDHLKTEHIGRLVIYAPVVSSSMHVINNLELINGLAVLPVQQTSGVGRSNNQWLSPLGCAMFSLQLHLAMDSALGSRLPLLQHLVGAAIVNSLRGHEQYGVLDISLKWPNDIYANGNQKIGGLVVNTTLQGSQAIVNIGSGINLNNSKPTVCINDLIREHNIRAPNNKLPILKYELFIATIFNEIERLLGEVQNGDFDSFYALYYSLWLHSGQTVKICLQNEQEREAEIVGIDDYGFLKVKLPNGAVETVQPDGNSFDMLKGLIVPKFQ
ncbi:biotin--protein ligase isoform X2 [Drosophila subpulchrella]|uniref:biotin--protein ligase isoform X2 n=1 Tax=Drosophila subpulchrella TaxID=1486046 RepID=UPI0018A13D82|nr:biotin--protein ligase isoform X2 [Drosophila subpulchrella]